MSKWDGERISTNCIPDVDSTDVKDLMTVKSSSCVLYSNAAKFSVMYRVKSTSSYGDAGRELILDEQL